MFMQYDPIVKAKLLGALKGVAEAGDGRLLGIEEECLAAIDRVMLAGQKTLTVGCLPAVSSHELADVLASNPSQKKS